MKFPENVKYTSEHEWIRLEGDVAYIGITDYAQEQLGDIVFVDIPTVGETLAAGEVFGTIEVVNKDPYGEGWLIKIKPAADADFASLLDVAAYKALING